MRLEVASLMLHRNFEPMVDSTMLYCHVHLKAFLIGEE